VRDNNATLRPGGSGGLVSARPAARSHGAPATAGLTGGTLGRHAGAAMAGSFRARVGTEQRDREQRESVMGLTLALNMPPPVDARILARRQAARRLRFAAATLGDNWELGIGPLPQWTQVLDINDEDDAGLGKAAASPPAAAPVA